MIFLSFLEVFNMKNCPYDQESLQSIQSNETICQTEDSEKDKSSIFSDDISLVSLEFDTNKASKNTSENEEVDWLETWFPKKVNLKLLIDEDLISKEASDLRIIYFQAILGLILSTAQVFLIVWITYRLIPNDPRLINIDLIDKFGKFFQLKNELILNEFFSEGISDKSFGYNHRRLSSDRYLSEGINFSF